MIFLVEILFRFIYCILYKISPSRLILFCLQPITIQIHFIIIQILFLAVISNDRLCGLVARIPGYTPRGPRSIPGDTRFLRSSEAGTGATQPREYN
jgi:hypothetical protein